MNNNILMQYHTGNFAEMDINYMSIVLESSSWYSETYFINILSEESIFVTSQQ